MECILDASFTSRVPSFIMNSLFHGLQKYIIEHVKVKILWLFKNPPNFLCVWEGGYMVPHILRLKLYHLLDQQEFVIYFTAIFCCKGVMWKFNCVFSVLEALDGTVNFEGLIFHKRLVWRIFSLFFTLSQVEYIVSLATATSLEDENFMLGELTVKSTKLMSQENYNIHGTHVVWLLSLPP